MSDITRYDPLVESVIALVNCGAKPDVQYVKYEDHVAEVERLRTEVEALRRLLSQSRKWVRAELGEFEMFVKRPGMVPEAYRFGGDRITELDALLCEIDAALKEPRSE